MDRYKQLLDELEALIISNPNNKDFANKINSIIKLLIADICTASNIGKENVNSFSSIPDDISNDINAKNNINKSTIINSNNKATPTINANNANHPTIKINTTNQPTININNINQASHNTNNDSSSETTDTTGEDEDENSPDDTADSSTTTSNTFSGLLTRINENILLINTLKNQLCLLPLNPCEKEYVANYISPLLSAANNISDISADLAASVSVLTSSPIVPRKKGKLKDTIHEIYDMQEETIMLYKIIKKRLNKLLDC